VFCEKSKSQDIHINTDAHPHSSIFWSARVENSPPVYLPDTLDTCQPGPSAERLSIFSDVDAVKAYMHVQNKLGPKSKMQKRFQTISPQNAKMPRSDLGSTMSRKT
jgi:hypothetical protein